MGGNCGWKQFEQQASRELESLSTETCSSTLCAVGKNKSQENRKALLLTVKLNDGTIKLNDASV